MQVENNLTTYTYHPQTQNNNACSDDFLKKSFIIIFLNWEQAAAAAGRTELWQSEIQGLVFRQICQA